MLEIIVTENGKFVALTNYPIATINATRATTCADSQVVTPAGALTVSIMGGVWYPAECLERTN
jgi:hypothetical protein